MDINLEAAKQAIAILHFHRDDLLEIALTDPCTLNESGLSKLEQEGIHREYRRLAFLGDVLIDAVLADHLYYTDPELDHADLDDYRQNIADRKSLTEFAIQLGLPDASSSRTRKNRKPPQDEPAVWGEMFEAVVGAIFLDADRNFENVSQWLCDRFLRDAIAIYDVDDELEVEEYEDIVYSTCDYLDAMGLENFPDTGWAPGDDDD